MRWRMFYPALIFAPRTQLQKLPAWPWPWECYLPSRTFKLTTRWSSWTVDSESRGVLMKFIYRGFEQPTENSSARLLVLHDKVFAVSGVGSIVRVLTDKKKVWSSSLVNDCWGILKFPGKLYTWKLKNAFFVIIPVNVILIQSTNSSSYYICLFITSKICLTPNEE